MCGDRRPLTLPVMLAGWLALAPWQPAAGQAPSAGPTAETTRPLIVMLSGRLGDEDTFGAGIIVGSAHDRLYIATANHVVRRGPRVIENLRVEFASLPGEAFEAELQTHFDEPLDLAVLRVSDVSRRKIPVEGLPFDRLGEPGALKRGDRVFTIGNARGRPWFSPVDPDKVSADVTGDQIRFESVFLARGHSGGGLFSRRWELLGMIRADEPPEGWALSASRLVEKLKEWGYPVALTRGGSGTAREPAERHPSGAPSARPPEPGWPALGRGKLCPALAGEWESASLVVAGRGVHKVRIGDCIELEPGYYAVREGYSYEAGERKVALKLDCRGPRIVIREAETTRPEVTCDADIGGRWFDRERYYFTFVPSAPNTYRYTMYVSKTGNAWDSISTGEATVRGRTVTLRGTRSIGSEPAKEAGKFSVSGEQMSGDIGVIGSRGLPMVLLRQSRP